MTASADSAGVDTAGRVRPAPAAGARRRFRPGGSLKGWIVPVAIVLLWEGLSRAGLFDPTLLPGPSAVLDELRYQLEQGDLFQHIGITLWRVVLGFGAGLAAATFFGALTGYSRTARALLDPTLQALKAVPSLAWVPLFILWFGIFEASKITLIAVGVFFPIYLALMSGIQDVDRKLVEVGRVMGFSRLAIVRRILLPATLPAFFIGARSGLALGWMFVIAAELMGASKGLGFLMFDGQMTGRPAQIIAALILFALIGKATDALLALCERRMLRWRDSFGGMKEGKPDAQP
ncbi:ABC transporter permease [Inquilinus sp. CAU 1745]|uniref:ABC transporter permease n=1 Tax=Inquilinus sp. CAU 1745 TaxID=3140369 RepID=UPI00325B9198